VLTTLLAWDAALAHAISRLAGWPPLDAVVSVLTMLGLYGAIWLLLGAALAWWRGGHVTEGFVRLAWSIILTTALIDGVLKPAIARPRPDVAGLTRTTTAAFVTSRTSGHSFPSGHAAQAAAGAYALGLMWPRRRAWLYVLGVLVALSRVYLGVHYPLDILAGAIVGWAAARFATGGTPCETPRSVGVAHVPG
jgi:undecaprenyl-diphosphatase